MFLAIMGGVYGQQQGARTLISGSALDGTVLLQLCCDCLLPVGMGEKLCCGNKKPQDSLGLPPGLGCLKRYHECSGETFSEFWRIEASRVLGVGPMKRYPTPCTLAIQNGSRASSPSLWRKR